jgi:hypothetical protein
MTKEHMKKHQRPLALLSRMLGGGRTDNRPWKLNTLWEQNCIIKMIQLHKQSYLVININYLKSELV